MATSLVHDTAFANLVRWWSRGKYFKHLDELDSWTWTPSADHDTSASTSSSSHASTLQFPETENGKESKSIHDFETGNGNGPMPISVLETKGPQMVTWAGRHDTENPLNWPVAKKCFVTFIICFFDAAVYIGSSIYSTGTQDIMRTFGVSQVAATLGLCLFVAGYGVGPMLFASMSEVPLIGRNPVYIGTLVVFVVLQVPAAKASSFGMLLAFRFLTGFFGSPVLATGGASLADIWSPAKRAYAISLWGVAAFFGPTIGPLIGGFAVEYAPTTDTFSAPWTWPLWILLWLSAFCLVVLFFFLPETSANNILLRRTIRLRRRAHLDKHQLTCKPELDQEHMTARDIVTMVLVRPLTLNFTEPMVLLLNLYIALIYGLLYIWFESFPIVFIDIYHFSLGTSGLAYLGLLIGMFIICPCYFVYLYLYLEPRFDANGNIRPEDRLTACFFGCWCIPICLFWFGWTARPDVHWIVPIIGSSWFSFGAFLLFNSILNYLPDAYPEYTASVLAGNDLMRSAFGAGFPLFATAMYRNLGVGWASSTLGFISIAFIPIPFVLYKYGETLRKNFSKHARKDI
ncbi:hypothetical protein A1O3_02706 [Capronia epimyces CBS 606.96]|uniref:Major facilitator superfamily (MFS) profile domain-containing protein n=1 Tax=Capronia epimyces CBS 606.96 TaxID=1182542 RepID=W9Z562_9EURO|nr:uncharacterized protein A1O3_02706 [Capronia epimyces CBS 606.96]EXJ89639.1 hypothetical protein A1O3_02706 [Capronia epimyces CBS 606.96]